MNIDTQPTEDAVKIANLEAENKHLHADYTAAQTKWADAQMRVDELERLYEKSCRKCERMFDMVESLIRIADR